MSYPWGPPPNPSDPSQPGQFGQQAPNPWQYPGQSGPPPGQPTPFPYGTPSAGYGPPSPPHGNRGMWITLGIAGVVVVLLAGAFIFVVPKNSNSAGGPSSPTAPSTSHPSTSRQSRSAGPPAGVPAPNNPIPPRTTQYSNFPAACSLVSTSTVQTLSPSATSKDSTLDNSIGGQRDYFHGCSWNAETSLLHDMSLNLTGITGDMAVDTINAIYKDTDLKESTPLDKVEDQRSIPNLGDQASFIVGIDAGNCRIGHLVLRSQNAIVDVTYGGCDADDNPLDSPTVVNGTMTMARDVLQHLNSANP